MELLHLIGKIEDINIEKANYTASGIEARITDAFDGQQYQLSMTPIKEQQPKFDPSMNEMEEIESGNDTIKIAEQRKVSGAELKKILGQDGWDQLFKKEAGSA